MNNDLISREALKKAFAEECCGCCDNCSHCMTGYRCELIDNAPTVEPFEKIGSICEENCGYNPQGKYVDISKLRLMTVEECAGHTIDYAMGWKACIEWIKKGGAE